MVNIKLKEINQSVYDKLDNTHTVLQKKIIASRLTKYRNRVFNPYKDIYQLPDLKEAGEVIANALKNKQYIINVCDNDADGITSSIVLHKAMKNIFKASDEDMKTIVNKREYGYGVNSTLVEYILTLHAVRKVDLIITADHGSSDELSLKRLRDNGIKIILTDHHMIPENNYPVSADYFINTQRKDNDKFTKNISGCYVAFITMLSTYESYYGVQDLKLFYELLPYVAISTISDVMDLTDPVNRNMIRYGLQEMNSLKNPLWSIIKKHTGLIPLVNSIDIGFVIAALINTGSRLNREDVSFNMLSSDNIEDSDNFTKELCALSITRKSAQKVLFNIAEKQVLEYEYNNSIVVVLETAYAINGIVAGRIGDVHNKPTICFIDNGSDTYNGSIRSIISGLDVLSVLKDMAKEDDTIFIKYGGHTMAAGCTIHREKLDIFKELFDKYCSPYVEREEAVVLYTDGKIDESELTPMLIKEIERCGPYGSKFEYPVFSTELYVKYRLVLDTVILITFITKAKRVIKGIFFYNKYSEIDKQNSAIRIKTNTLYNVVYQPHINSFRGAASFQLQVLEIQPKG